MTRTAIFSLVLASLLTTPVLAQPRITPAGQLPQDVRLLPLKDLNG